MSVAHALLTAALIGYAVGLFVYCLGSIHLDRGDDR